MKNKIALFTALLIPVLLLMVLHKNKNAIPTDLRDGASTPVPPEPEPPNASEAMGQLLKADIRDVKQPVPKAVADEAEPVPMTEEGTSWNSLVDNAGRTNSVIVSKRFNLVDIARVEMRLAIKKVESSGAKIVSRKIYRYKNNPFYDYFFSLFVDLPATVEIIETEASTYDGLFRDATGEDKRDAAKKAKTTAEDKCLALGGISATSHQESRVIDRKYFYYTTLYCLIPGKISPPGQKSSGNIRSHQPSN